MSDIPWRLPTPSDGGFWIANPSESGGIAMNGAEQVLVSLAMHIRGKVVVNLRTTDDVLEARAFFAEAAGKAGDILVPFFDGKRVNWPVDQFGRKLKPALTRHRELDGTIFEEPEVPDASEVIATLVGSVAVRATSATINISQGAPIKRGQWFSLGGRRAYMVRGVSAVIAGSQVVNFYPPIRQPATSGDAVEFTRPVCLMNQMNDDQGIQILDSWQRTTLTLEFRESLNIDDMGSGS